MDSFLTTPNRSRPGLVLVKYEQLFLEGLCVKLNRCVLNVVFAGAIEVVVGNLARRLMTDDVPDSLYKDVGYGHTDEGETLHVV